MRNFEFIHIINYIIEKEIHIFVHENNYKIINHTDAAQFLVFCNMTLLFPNVYGFQICPLNSYKVIKDFPYSILCFIPSNVLSRIQVEITSLPCTSLFRHLMDCDS